MFNKARTANLSRSARPRQEQRHCERERSNPGQSLQPLPLDCLGGSPLAMTTHSLNPPLKSEEGLERFPLGWNHPSDKNSLSIQKVRACSYRKTARTFAEHALSCETQR